MPQDSALGFAVGYIKSNGPSIWGEVCARFKQERTMRLRYDVIHSADKYICLFSFLLDFSRKNCVHFSPTSCGRNRKMAVLRCSGAINRRASTQHRALLARSALLEPAENILDLTTSLSVDHGPC